MTEFTGATFSQNDVEIIAVEKQGDDIAILVRCPNCDDFTVVGYLVDRDEADLFIAAISVFLGATIFPVH
jgi:hypothetical protein